MAGNGLKECWDFRKNLLFKTEYAIVRRVSVSFLSDDID